jgi:hypothetical protein
MAAMIQRPPEQEENLGGELAAVAEALVYKMQTEFKHARLPEYADFRDAFRLRVERAIFAARLDEARSSGLSSSLRVQQLAREVARVEREIKSHEPPERK